MHFKTQMKPSSIPFNHPDRFESSPFAHEGTDLEDLFDSPEHKKVHEEQEVIVHISPLGNNLNFLCQGMDQLIGVNDGTTNAQTPTYEAPDDLMDCGGGMRRKSKNLDEEDDAARAPSRMHEDDDIEMRMFSSEVTRSVSKMDITYLEMKIKAQEKQINLIQGGKNCEKQGIERKTHYFGTVQKENQVRRIKFLDDLDSED